MKNLLGLLALSLISSSSFASSWSYVCSDKNQLITFNREQAVIALDADDESLVYKNQTPNTALKGGNTLTFSRGLNLTQIQIASVGPEIILEKDYSYACKNGVGDLYIKSQRTINALVAVEDMEATSVVLTCEITEFTHGECY